jgi:hypothetical protein
MLPTRVLVAVFVDEDGALRVVADETGRIVAASTERVGGAFVTALQKRGVRSCYLMRRSAGQVTDLLVRAGVEDDVAPECVRFLEAEAEDGEDALRWAREVAARVPVRDRRSS